MFKCVVAALGACVALAFGTGAAAAPVLTFEVQVRSGAPSLVDVTVRASGLVADGLIAAHVDLNYDTSAVSLVSARAGDFFTLNAAGGSLWSDTVSAGLAAGDDLVSSIFDATTGPDTLGFDLLEIQGFASFLDGVLMRWVFDIGTSALPTFVVNDALLVNATGVAFPQAMGPITGGPGTPLSTPGALGLSLLGLVMLARARAATSA